MKKDQKKRNGQQGKDEKRAIEQNIAISYETKIGAEKNARNIYEKEHKNKRQKARQQGSYEKTAGRETEASSTAKRTGKVISSMKGKINMAKIKETTKDTSEDQRGEKESERVRKRKREAKRKWKGEDETSPAGRTR